MLLKEIQPKTELSFYLTDSKGRDPSSSHPFLFFTFLFDQVHQRVRSKIHWPVRPSHRSG